MGSQGCCDGTIFVRTDIQCGFYYAAITIAHSVCYRPSAANLILFHPHQLRGNHQMKGKIALDDNSKSNIRIDGEHLQNGN